MEDNASVTEVEDAYAGARTSALEATTPKRYCFLKKLKVFFGREKIDIESHSAQNILQAYHARRMELKQYYLRKRVEILRRQHWETDALDLVIIRNLQQYYDYPGPVAMREVMRLCSRVNDDVTEEPTFLEVLFSPSQPQPYYCQQCWPCLRSALRESHLHELQNLWKEHSDRCKIAYNKLQLELGSNIKHHIAFVSASGEFGSGTGSGEGTGMTA